MWRRIFRSARPSCRVTGTDTNDNDLPPPQVTPPTSISPAEAELNHNTPTDLESKAPLSPVPSVGVSYQSRVNLSRPTASRPASKASRSPSTPATQQAQRSGSYGFRTRDVVDADVRSSTAGSLPGQSPVSNFTHDSSPRPGVQEMASVEETPSKPPDNNSASTIKASPLPIPSPPQPQPTSPALPSTSPLAPLYRCSLCFDALPAATRAPFTLPDSSGRVFCERCWRWIYDVAICWRCGEVVARADERVAFGWLWWHWGCFCCLICRAQLPPPRWDEGARVAELERPPLCPGCRRAVEGGLRRRETGTQGRGGAGARANGAMAEARKVWRTHVSIYDPLNGGFEGVGHLRSLPSWMVRGKE